MDAATIGFLAVVVLASGLIAYIADLLGRKLGKKRLTLGSMRPRHTAALMTTLSGMLISVLTIAIVMALSSDVRDWILRGNRAISESKRLERDLTAKQVEFSNLTRQKSALDQQVGSLHQRVRSLNEDVAKSRKRASDAAQSLKSAQSNLAAAQSRYRQAQARYDAARARYASAQASLVTKQAQLASTQKDLGAANRDVKEAVRQKNDAEQQWIKLDHDYQAMEGQLKVAKSELAARQKELDGVNGDLVKAGEQYGALKQQLNGVQAQLEQAKLDLDRARAAASAIVQNNLNASRLQPLVVSEGQELARIQLEPGQSPEQVSAALENLIVQSQRSAKELGVKPARPGATEANLKDQKLENGKLITVEQQKQAIVRAASNLQDKSVVIATSIWNVFEGEDVPLQVVAYRNPLVYKEGQIVAETRIDGTKEDQAILVQLTDFVRGKIKQKALADRMIPAAGREQSFGSIPLEELFSLTRDIKGTNRQVRLVAVAKQDTRAADPLKLDLRIR